MRRAWTALAAVGVLAGCGGGGEPGEAAAPETHEVTVMFHLEDYDTAYFECEGSGGYSDIGSGTSVTIKNGDGDVLGAGKLGKGRASSNGTQAAFCDWTVKIPDVPAGEKFYVAEVGGRGESTMAAADLEAEDWTFSLTLGEL